ncbi:MAG: UTP--glucose-1-phosphate uridylyltransferase, partial [Desulfovibrio sp.]|nr:UTP--glucose-1-phosphate uridylyltransferase [Desulfovibrio sp.]
RQGKVAAFTVAGGQGTRLGYDGPKGTYAFSPLRHKTLFQYFAESLLNNRRKYAAAIPWYIMTSPANNAATVAFFQEHGFFGLPPEDVKFFIQGTLPGFGLDGRALLEAPDSLALFANGHGGTLAALRDSGTLDDMARRGVDYLSYFQVDNPLIAVCDPLFIGLHHLSGSEMSSRALIKRDAKEKLGHFCDYEGHLTVVEYSDMPDSLTSLKDADGQLTFRAGSPAMHVINRTFVERLTAGRLALTPHRANKKIACLDAAGRKPVVAVGSPAPLDALRLHEPAQRLPGQGAGRQGKEGKQTDGKQDVQQFHGMLPFFSGRSDKHGPARIAEAISARRQSRRNGFSLAECRHRRGGCRDWRPGSGFFLRHSATGGSACRASMPTLRHAPHRPIARSLGVTAPRTVHGAKGNRLLLHAKGGNSNIPARQVASTANAVRGFAFGGMHA